MDVNIPGYTVINRIGGDGLATIYLAYQHNLERQVALKLSSSHLATNPECADRFLRKAMIGAGLFHRHIVPVYECGCFRDQYFLTMEYLPGGDFRQRMNQGCSAGAAMRIVYDIASALEYAHTKALVHGDIRPENILFREDGSAVLTGFGITEELQAEVDHLRAGMNLSGSAQYMSPERIGGEELDKRADIYSLGVVLFEALSGRPLLDSTATVVDALIQIEDPVPLLPSELSALQPLLYKMLAKNRDARFSTMAEVMLAMKAFLDSPEAFKPVSPKKTSQASPGTASLIELENSDYEPTESFLRDWPMDEAESPLADSPSIPTKPRRRSHFLLLSAVALLAALPVGLHQWPTLVPDALDSVAQLGEHPQAPMLEQAQEQAQEPTLEQTPAPVEPLPLAVAVTPPESAPADLAPSTIAELPAPGAIVEKAAETPAETPGEAVARLLAEAGNVMQSSPSDTRAYGQYQEVLQLDPGNRAALNGIAMVTGRYLDLASAALNQDKLDSAQRYVDRASTLTSRHGLSSAMSQRVTDLQYTLNRIRALE